MIIVCAHPKRERQALALANQVGGLIVWDEKDDEIDTHLRAWQLARDARTWATVIEDDAVAVTGFTRHLADALATAEQMYPNPGSAIVSLYVGTSRPDRRTVSRAVAKAEETGASWLVSARLRWGVGVSVHASQIPSLLTGYRARKVPSDQRVSDWAERRGIKVLHTYPSLLDHSDGQPLITTRHDGQPRTEQRVAHRFGVPAWNTIQVPM